MLDKRSNNTEAAPARRVLRFLGLDDGRSKESPTAKNCPPKSPRSESINSPSGIFLPLFSE